MYAFNKQVSKYVVMVFFSSKISIVSLLLTGYIFVLLRIARPLNARLCIHLVGF